MAELVELEAGRGAPGGVRWDRSRVATLGLVAGALVLAWSILGVPSALASPTAAGTDAVTVHIGEHGLTPAVVTAPPGGTIVWVNDATSTRTIVAADASFDSGPLAHGERFQFAFTQARTVTYNLAEAPEVTGTITVAGGAAVAGAAPVPGPAVTPAPIPADPQPAGFAFTGSATAVNGMIGGLVLALGAGLLMVARRVGLTAALGGFSLALMPDDLLPTRRHRRRRRERARRVLGRGRSGRA